MDQECELPDDFDHFEYYRYIWGDNMPDVGIRVLIDKAGKDKCAECMDLETGQLRRNLKLHMSMKRSLQLQKNYNMDVGLDLVRVDEEEFRRLNAVRKAWAEREKAAGKWKNPPYISVRAYASLYGPVYQGPFVVLWRRFEAGLPVAETAACLVSGLHLVFRSGVYSYKIENKHVAPVYEALRRDLPMFFDRRHEDLLALIARKFTKADGEDMRDDPDFEICEFLRKEGIPYTSWRD